MGGHFILWHPYLTASYWHVSLCRILFAEVRHVIGLVHYFCVLFLYCSRPTAESMVAMVTQAVHGGDKKLLEVVLQENRERVIQSTVRKLPLTSVVPFLTKVSYSLENSNYRWRCGQNSHEDECWHDCVGGISSCTWSLPSLSITSFFPFPLSPSFVLFLPLSFSLSLSLPLSLSSSLPLSVPPSLFLFFLLSSSLTS